MNVQNQCWIYAVGNGETLHASLIPKGTLSQSFNTSSSAFVPDWSGGNGPKIYLSLLAGNVPKQPEGGVTGGTWYHNGTALTFDGSGNCTNKTYTKNGSTCPLFLRTTEDVPIPNSNPVQYVSLPALKINGNLASGGNIDLDSIRFVGLGELDGATHDIDLTLPVRLAEWNGSGYLGQILFTDSQGNENGENVIRTANGKVYAKARLIKDAEMSQGSQGVNGDYRCIWKLNGSVIATDVYFVEISQAQVTDYATLECEFYLWNDTTHANLLTTAAEGIDDQQDPEYLYRNHELHDGTEWGDELRGGECYVHKKEKTRFVAWMGTTTDETVDDTWTLYARFCGINGATLAAPSGNTAGIASLAGKTASSGYYQMTKDNTTKKWRTPEVTWEEACAQGMNISVFIKASK